LVVGFSMIFLRACGVYCPVKQKCMAFFSRWIKLGVHARSDLLKMGDVENQETAKPAVGTCAVVNPLDSAHPGHGSPIALRQVTTSRKRS